MATFPDSNFGWVTGEIGIGTLSSNKYCFINAACYSASYQQRARVKIKPKGESEYTIFDFGPNNGTYKELGSFTFDLANTTFYDVEVGISNDGGTGKWKPSTVTKPDTNSTGNYNDFLVTSEDLPTADDVNDTIVRIVWFTQVV